jgi:hypothetical protein
MKKQEEEESVCRQVNIQAIVCRQVNIQAIVCRQVNIQAIANWKKHGQHL